MSCHGGLAVMHDCLEKYIGFVNSIKFESALNL